MVDCSIKPTIYLIDGSAYIHRAYHAVRGLSNSKGIPTNAIFGFTRMLIKLMEDRKPQYVAMVFDSKGPTFRHEMYPNYKANRPPMPEDLIIQVPYIKEILDGFQIPSIEVPGFEADDLIGTLAHQAEAQGFCVVMVTGDKDFVQLITDHITIWDPMKDKTIDNKSVLEEFGLKPYQLIDVMGLSGDPSDNIPGVPGIGMKTAVELIKIYGSIDRMYELIGSMSKKKQKENLLQHKDDALLSRKLVTINTQAPIIFNADQFKWKGPDHAKLFPIFQTLEFRQLQKEFPPPSNLSQKNYTTIFGTDDLKKLVSDLTSIKLFALDTETTSENPMTAKLVGISVSYQPNHAYYIPCGHCYLGAPEQIQPSEVLEILKPILENPEIKKVGQNIKYDWMVLDRYGISLQGVIFDTMIASYLINPSKRAHNLDQIALDFLNYQKISYKELSGKGKHSNGFEGVPIDQASLYACEDADITLMAYQTLHARIKDAGLSNLMETVEMPLIPVLMHMEKRGIIVDQDCLIRLSKTFEQQLDALEKQIYMMAGEEFNIQSSQQLGYILFEKLHLPTQKKTRKKTAYSTDADVLETLAIHHELPALIIRHRTLSKLKSAYTDALVKLIHPETGRIHTSFNQTVTATGRLSSTDPNLQNIPVREEEGKAIRSAFIAPDGWYLLSADYSQIELRILAHYSEDPILLEAFQENQDIHTRTATEVFQTYPELVTPELRRQAKAINFGIIYGMSPFGLSKELGISQKMAKTYIHNYFNRYKGVKAFIEKTISDAEKNRYTSTLLGRIRFVPDITSSNRILKQAAERVAINTPIQGTAADLIKLAMIRVHSEMQNRKMASAMLLSVHDELLFETPPEEQEELQNLVTEIMENVHPNLRVKLKVNIALGKNWAQAH